MPVELDMPWASLDTMPATGSPGIRRGNAKFRMKAKTKVIKNQSSFVPKYFRYPFNSAPLPDFIDYQCGLARKGCLLGYIVLLLGIKYPKETSMPSSHII